MRVVLAHDYLTQRGGAERLALQLTRTFPGAPMFTSVFDRAGTFDEFAQVDVRTTGLQHIGSLRRDPRKAVIALPIAWSRIRIPEADVVVASSTGFAHGIQVPDGCRKIVYCHNPARWLYQPDDYFRGRAARSAFALARPGLVAWDKQAAASADVYVANSAAVAGRIWDTYGIDAQVVHPPVTVDVTGDQQPIEGIEPGYWLTIARGRGYKNVDAVIEGTSSIPGSRLVIAGADGDGDDPPHVQRVGVVSDAELRWLYANARALVSVAREDFGLTPIEANAFGTPVAVLRAGGFLESTDEGVSGAFVEAATASEVAAALANFPEFDPVAVRQHAARFSAAAFDETIRALVGVS